MAFEYLSHGSRSDRVKEMQQKLIGAGYSVGAARDDGIFGNDTQAALKKYQEANRLAVTGDLDESTYNKLYGVTANNTAQQSPAQQQLQQVQQTKPADFSSAFDAPIQDAYNAIMGRQPFNYDLNSDALYQQYKDAYMQQGRQAMMDTTGQAAMLTGGYGNSYAATAGNQAYQQYLTRLNEIIPELEERAYGRYAAEGERMMDNYAMLNDMRDREYQQYKDKYSMWADERDAAKEDARLEKDQAYEVAMMMLQLGKMPSADLLAAAGLTSGDAATLHAGIQDANKPKYVSSGDSAASADYSLMAMLYGAGNNDMLKTDSNTGGELGWTTPTGQQRLNWGSWTQQAGRTYSVEQAADNIYAQLQSREINEEQALAALRQLGITI